MHIEPGQVTQILARLKGGDRTAEDDLIPLIYSDLRRIAGALMHAEMPGISLQATVLVDDVLIKILRGASVDWQDRSHFYAIAAKQMRFILIDRAKRTKAQRRPDPHKRLPLDAVMLISQGCHEELLEIDQALRRLAAEYPVHAQAVEMRVFAGYTHLEIGKVLGMSERNVKRYWTFARAWLYRELNNSNSQAASA